MVMVQKRASEKPLTVPENWYTGQIKNVEAKIGKYGPCFRITFSLLEIQGAEAAIVLSQDLYNGSKLDLLLKALGYALPDGSKFDTDILLQDRPKVVILTEQNSSADGTVYNNVSKIKPYKQVAASTAPVTAAPTPTVTINAAVPVPVTAAAVPVVPPDAPAPVVPAAAPASYIENVEEIDFNA